MAKQEKSQWSQEVRSLLGKLDLSQKRLAALVGVSPPTVTRWLNGTHEPTAASYMAMGNLLGLPGGAYFWERAGLDPANLSGNKLNATLSSLKVSLKDFRIFLAGKRSREILNQPHEMVLVPLFNIKAYGDEYPPGPHITIAKAEIVDLFIAPASWCPHPEHALCMKLSGHSMMPLIPDDSIICVDTAITDREQLNRKIAVFSHRDHGFKVARLRRVSAADIMVSANYHCLPVDVTDSSAWKAVGEVVWWLSKDSASG
ncbi:helix-turn-helix domain-containing protein [Terracidiphilus gabretensis]|jgi:transcriptional regulator with XRE-family HTH domain|uniref:helix-turn-helix domain-containing protein n=1 Tax=Terracidiphilus gabretensis TaxID=1577687 RepID=UPI00071B8106|nr:helix-turn-helix domain-containing protein [Terracidiphilus gabretensis]